MDTHRNYFRAFLLGFLVYLCIGAPVSASSFSQNNWSGGSGQTSFSDTSKFYTAGNVITNVANQLKISTNLGTGADGPCVVTSGSVALDALTNNSCAGRATADAVNINLISSVPAGATSIPLPVVYSFPATTILTHGRSTYADGQKWVRMGPDNLLRFVYLDPIDWKAIRFVRCLNESCTSFNDNVVATPGLATFVDFATLTMGTDGFARISYTNYSDQHFIQCLNADCTNKTDNLVDSGSYYEVAHTLNNNNFGRILSNDYGASHLYMVVCTTLSCSTNNRVDLGAFNYGSTFGMVNGSDGFVHIVYYDNLSSTNNIHYIHCQNDACSSFTNTVIASTNATDYYLDMVALGNGKYGIAYEKSGNGTLVYILCSNEDCSTSSTNTLDTKAQQVSIAATSTGLPRVLYETGSDGNHSKYVTCETQDCGSINVYSVSSHNGYPVSLAVAADDSPRMLDYDRSSHLMQLLTFGTSSLSNTFSAGDEVLIMNQKGTSTDYSNVGKYETRYVTKVNADSSLSLDAPLTNAYDGTTQKILLQRIPQYTTVNVDPSFAPPTSGLVGHWKMDESSWNGTSGEVVDSSGSGNNGTAQGGASTVAGKYGRSGFFDGYSHQYVKVADNAAYKPTTAITLALWFRTTQWVNFISTNSTANIGYDLHTIIGTGVLQFNLGNGTQFNTVSNSAVNDGTWHHAVGTWDGTTMKLYVDGVLQSQTTAMTGTITYNTLPLNIGAHNDGADSFMFGNLDDVRVYNRALSQSEVTALAKSATLTISPYSTDTFKGGVLFFRALGAVTVGSGGTIGTDGTGYNGGSGGFTSETGGLTYNGQGGNNGLSGQGGGGGTDQNSGLTGRPGTLGGGGGSGANGCTNACSGGGGGGYGTVGHGDTTLGGHDGNGSIGGDSGPNTTPGIAGGGGGGGTYGVADLSQIYFGSGGGGSGPNGGAGGGILSIVANSITNSGNILSDGGWGGTTGNGGGAGGGAGGSVLLKANSIASTGFIQALAGKKGYSGDQNVGVGDGGDGGNGRIALYAPSLSGSTSPSAGTAAAIGNASSGTVVSSIFDSNQSSSWGALTYSANTPTNTGIQIRVRTSNNADMSGASDFSNCPAIASGSGVDSSSCVHNGDRYVQYQVRLTTSDTLTTPTFNSLKIEYGKQGEITTSAKSDPGPNVHENWKYPVDAGSQFVGEIKPITRVEAPGASIIIPNDAAHDPLHVSIDMPKLDDLKHAKPPIPMPWNEGYSTLSGDIYHFSLVSAFNGFPIPAFDKPVTITLPYDPALLKGRNPKLLKILWYDERARRWKALSTPNVVDVQNHTVSNTTKYVGYFAVGFGSTGSVVNPTVKPKKK